MPAAIPIIALGVSAATSAYSIASAESAKAKAKKAAAKAEQDAKNYKRQDLTNPYDNNAVSTLGADRQREDLARTMTSYGNLAAMGGSRAIAGMTPQMLSQQNQQEAQIAANLDQQEVNRQMLISQGRDRVQQMTEQREKDDLLGIGNAWNVAQQNIQHSKDQAMQGYMGLAQTGLATVQAYKDGLFKKDYQPPTGNFMTDAMGNLGIYRQRGVGRMRNLPGAEVELIPANSTVAPNALPNSPIVIPNNPNNFAMSGKTTGGVMYQEPMWMRGLYGGHKGWNPYGYLGNKTPYTP